MDKNAIKKFAVWARTELIARVSLKGVEYGITEDNIEDANADSVGGKVLTADEKKQRQALIAEINDKGYKQVMEEVAYTWFNRFSALRFMEVNGYLPSHVRVFTDEENNFKPQIITEAIHLDLDGLDMEKVYELKDAEKTEELYKYLLIVQCNALNKILPGMFQKIADYTELLLPDNLLREGSVIQQMIELIPEDDWKDAVQIIGWLYQYYNSEKKDDVFAALKKNVKITKENIPAATQLFTPDWIVRYMVENSLGRLWLEGHPDVKEQLLPTEEEQSVYAAGNRDPEDTKWHYYLEEAEQEPEVQAQLAEIRKEYAALTPDQLKVIDPCSGSGHILAYMFDVLMKIYESYGYTTREAVASIVENNLYGLDIDDRAAQLAYFAVMMKARQYDRRFFSRGIQPHVYAIMESNHVDKFAVDYFCNGDAKLTAAMDTIIKELHDAKEYGSILTVTPQDWSALYERFAEITEDINMSREAALRGLLPLVQVAEALALKYDTVVTNPPYMSSSGMGSKLTDYAKKNYPNSKSDLYAMFIQVCIHFGKRHAFEALITQHSWMFLGSYEKLRDDIYKKTIVNMAHLGARAFEEIAGEVVQTTAFVLYNSEILDYAGKYVRLVAETSQNDKEKKYLSKENLYSKRQKDYASLPSAPVGYWVGDAVFRAFKEYPHISDIGEAKAGMTTGDNDRFLRLWHEVKNSKIGMGCHNSDEAKKSEKKWFPYNKGGGFRKWYGLNDYVVLWENDGYAIKNATKQGRKIASVRSERLYFRKSITWATLTTGMISCRNSEYGHLFDDKGSSCFMPDREYNYVLAFINSVVGDYFLHVLNPTMSFQSGNIGALPIISEKVADSSINNLSLENVNLCKADWDSFETSWDFQHHPLLRKVPTIAEAFDQWQTECDERFNQLKANEEELNQIFIDIYGLQDELTPEVEDKDVTVRKADLGRDIRSFISYAIGCMFGRYSLDMDGLAYAGGEWDASKYVSFAADKDNIIPICDDEYFEDDIVGLFVKFVKTVYGADTLDENLKFIADALGGKGQPKDVIRNYFLSNFYSDHCKIYQKRPIYWLFDSGKKNGFKALIYMHRYQPDTIARIRTDYVHEQQARYRTAIVDLEQRIANASTGERVKLNKKLTTLQAQDTEIRTYEEKIHHLADQMISIDLDDGVKKNYAIFQDILAKIK
ncbi:restriction endonuclease [Enterocloster bolteae 90A5]|uniref:BREX-1 system adenine-specific DNA-methyltransferase PglX n=1 Tax=Enterocloster bolteae TaxID=208479 RepID=UPI0002D1F303|nr:BREX-1 system adenine-specific DNA-methyltransferase PglX [Enterocloster bolteae]ENZ53728.1 restriction endonuclease [Enterocloster bolteae 90A5]